MTEVMIRITLLLCILSLSQGIKAQKVFWSDLSHFDVEEAIQTADRFIRGIETGHSDSLSGFLAGSPINFGGDQWLDGEVVLDRLLALTPDKSFVDLKLHGYRFDDFLENYTSSDIIRVVYRVFDNHSVIIHALYDHQSRREDALLIMKKNKEGWKITGIAGFGMPFSDVDKRTIPGTTFRNEKLHTADLILPVPGDFSKADYQENQVNFYLKGQTERDAVFQVMVDERKQKMYFYTYKLVEYNHQHYELSDLIVRYLPFGILFEYTVVDLYGIKNKGITVGLETRDRSVIIQFYSLIDIYYERKEEVDYVFRNIVL